MPLPHSSKPGYTAPLQVPGGSHWQLLLQLRVRLPITQMPSSVPGPQSSVVVSPGVHTPPPVHEPQSSHWQSSPHWRERDPQLPQLSVSI
jgi:hypothetical protein